MARWPPDAQQRLMHAALDLFSEQGYDSTTVAQVARRAGLTTSTFFRHFPDKREVLFVGQDALRRLITDTIATAPRSVTALQAITAALDAVGEIGFTPDRRDFARQRRHVIAANSELRERDALKRGGLIAAMSKALQQRGISDPSATVAAELGGLALNQAFARWTAPTNTREFSDLARETLHTLHAASSTLR